MLFRSKRLKDLLRNKIKNPKTGNDILVKTALGYQQDSPARKAAMMYIQKNMK